MSSLDWKDTTLWQWLESRGAIAEPTREYVRTWLADVQILLSKGATAPPDFTLHDDEHSFRVSQRIADLIPPETVDHLSEYEIGLLLKASYLHDIGMNPRRVIVSNVRNYLLSGVNSVREFDGELSQLQRWLDIEHSGIEPPIEPDSEISYRLRMAETLTAHYCRFRHNDWSGDYITSTCSDKIKPPYQTWVDDLILLCKSHHYGLNELMTPDFNLRIAGAGNKLVNLRYLATLLRLADVLEFDPERTPEVVFLQRDVAPSSHIFWHKDHAIVLAIEKTAANILITARTKDAWTHRAVLETADSIDVELNNCAAIERQNGFLQGVKLDFATHYKWPWPAKISRDIKPIGNTFEYIEGTFRPNTKKIISLLGGTALYGTPLAAVRELLQNAFDAIREQIATELVLNESHIDSIDPKSQAASHRISIRIEEESGRLWLKCADTGTGMTRRVIERYLLISGSQPRPEVLELGRRCAARGVPFVRTGEFGIGVLSYFMIADKMVLETRPSIEAYPDAETHGWRFETEGLDAFGELRPYPQRARGSTIKLRIKDNLNNSDFAKRMFSYISAVISVSPCTVDVRLGDESVVLGPGWTKSTNDFSSKIVTLASDESQSETLKSQRRAKIDEELRDAWEQVGFKIDNCLKFFGPREGGVPHDLGAFRIHVPFFDLGDGFSPVFLDIRDGKIHAMPDGRTGASAKGVKSTSWRGFSTARPDHGSFVTSHANLFNSLVEVDLIKGGAISLDRARLQVDDRQIANFLSGEFRTLEAEFLAGSSPSIYDSLSPAWMRNRGERIKSSYWAFAERMAKGQDIPLSWEWKQIEFPALVDTRPLREYAGQKSQEYLDVNGIICELRPLEFENSRKKLPLSGVHPSRLLIEDGLYFPKILLLFNEIGPFDDRPLSADFPDEWSHMLAAVNEELIVFNRNHLLYKKITPDIWIRYLSGIGQLPVSDRLSQAVEQGSEAAACFIIFNADERNEFWNALRDNLPKDFAKLMDCLSIPTDDPAIAVWRSGYEGGLRTIGRYGARFKGGRLIGDGLVPRPEDTKWFSPPISRP